MRRRWTWVVAATLGTSLSAVAHAQSRGAPGVELEYRAPAGCGSRGEVLDKVRRLGGNPSDGRERTVATVVVIQKDDRYEVRYSARTGTTYSRRTLIVDSCGAATEAAALLLLLTVDPLFADTLGPSVVDAPETSPDPAFPPPEPTAQGDEGDEGDAAAAGSDGASNRPATLEVKPQQRASPEDTQPSRSGDDGDVGSVNELWLGMGGRWTTGTTPRVAFGGGIAAGARFGWATAELDVAWMKALNGAVPGIEGSRVLSTLWAAHLDLGARIEWSVVSYGPYLGIGAVRLNAETRGLTEPGAGASQWLTGSGGVRVSTAITRSWGVFAKAGAVLSLQRPRFFVAGVGDARVVAHQPDSFGTELFVGLTHHWGSQTGSSSASTRR